MNDQDFKDLIDELKTNVTLDALFAHKILEPAHNFNENTNRGIVCPLCGSGTGKNQTGAGSFDDEHGFYCFSCKNAEHNGHSLSTIDLYMLANNTTNFKEAVLDMAQEFLGSSSEDYSSKRRSTTKTKRKSVDEKTAAFNAEYLRLIGVDVAKAQDNIGNLPAVARRGLSSETLEHFHFGYLPDWINTKCRAYFNVGLYVDKKTGKTKFLPPPSRRIIIPTSTTHYNAVMLAADRTPENKDFWKQHAGKIELFNEEALLADTDTIIVVEGEIDCASIWQATGGNVAVVAAIGGNGKLLLDALKKHNVTGKKFIVLFDNDQKDNGSNPGQQHAATLTNALLKRGYPVANAILEDALSNDELKACADSNGKVDANQILQANGDQFLRNVVNKILARTSPPPPVEEKNSSPDDKYAPLFEGLEPVRVSAGAILRVVDSNVKPFLETLFVEKNFIGFVHSIINNSRRHSDDSQSELVYASDGDAYELSNSQVEFAITWLVRNVAPFFNGKLNDMRLMLRDRLKAAQSQHGASFFQDLSFIKKALQGVDVQPFCFEDKFKQELRDFADHSDGILESLVRFDYERTAAFLDEKFTDLSCAETLVDVQNKFIRFDTNQATWYHWADNHWQALSGNSNAHIYELWSPIARKTRVFADFDLFKKSCEDDDFAICNKITKTNTPAVEKKKRLDAAVKAAQAKVKETLKLESSRAIDSLISQAAGLPEIKTTIDKFDRHPYLFNCANCTIDLRTMDTFPARQEDLLTVASKTVYDPQASCVEWDNFLKSALPDSQTRHWAKVFFGYSLTGLTKEQKLLFVYGDGGTGKSTFLKAIGGAFGDYAQVFPPELITENSKPKDGNEASPIMAQWRNARIVRSDETKKHKKLDEATVKRLTGSDPIVAREMYKAPFQFDPTFKMIIDGNYMPAINDMHDTSLRRRIVILPFLYAPEPDEIDTSLSEKLATPQARSAILNWCLEGCREYLRRGLPKLPALMIRALDSFYDENDIVSAFLDDVGYELGDKGDPKYQTPVMAVWRKFNEWRTANPHTPAYKKSEFIKAFLQTFDEEEVELHDVHHQKRFVGIKLNVLANAAS